MTEDLGGKRLSTTKSQKKLTKSKTIPIKENKLAVSKRLAGNKTPTPSSAMMATVNERNTPLKMKEAKSSRKTLKFK